MDGLSAAASGMLADEKWQQVIMNNVANLSTPGFKQSSGVLMAFPQQLIDRYTIGSNGRNAVAVGPVSNGAFFQESVNDFAQGTIKPTGQPLDLAIQDPVTQGSSVYALVPGAGGAPPAVSQVSSLSFVVGRGGVIETAQGYPLVPVDAAGAPIPNARVVLNPQYKGLDLFGENGGPVVNAAGQPSYLIEGPGGKKLPTSGENAASLRMTSSVTGGVHNFFAVENIDAAGVRQVALTRDGHFQMGPNHLLYNASGQRVLAIGANGRPLLNTGIEINPAYRGNHYFGKNGAPLFDKNGQPSYLIAGTNGAAPPAGAGFGTVAADVNTLRPLGQTDFLLSAQTRLAPGTGQIVPGALEMSNASDTHSMISMINIYQNYAANQKMIQTIDTTLRSAAQDVGLVQGL